MDKINFTVEQLRNLLGTCVTYHGDNWRVVEVLEDGPSLVLVNQCNHHVVQADQYGDGQRRVVEHLTVQILTDDGEAFHPDYLALNLMDKGSS